MGEQASGLGTVSGIRPGSAGGDWPGLDRGRCPGVGAAAERSRAAVTAQIARAAMTSTVCRAMAVEVRRDPQHIGLAAGFQELPQTRSAAAVHLVAAHEVQPHAVGGGLGEDVDGQLALGAEGQAFGRVFMDQGLDGIADLLSAVFIPGRRSARARCLPAHRSGARW